jgi:ArsR family transcriptional regulator
MMNGFNPIPVFKALADDTRLQILEMLSGGEFCACKLLERFQFTQPTLSYHMKILTESGLVSAVRDGSWMRYTLNTARFEQAQAFLAGLTSRDADASGEATTGVHCCRLTS